MYLREIRFLRSLDWTLLAQDRNRGRYIVKTVMDLQVP
jgi:hypothetical protein